MYSMSSWWILQTKSGIWWKYMETMRRLDVQKERKNLGSVGVDESQGVTAGAIRANDGLNIMLSC